MQREDFSPAPLFAFAIAGVVLSMAVIEDREPLVAGKPLGMLAAAALAVWLRIAIKPDEYSWRQVGGAGALSDIGFTMSLFIAGEAFTGAANFDAAKIAVFAASLLAAVPGVAILWNVERVREQTAA